jgi:hypothetical protein
MTRSKLFISVGLLVGLLLSACGEDEGPDLSGYAGQCMTTEDCEEPLMCVAGLCTIACSNIAECADVDPSGESLCQNGRCYIACTDQVDCDDYGLRCVMAGNPQGTCLP